MLAQRPKFLAAIRCRNERGSGLLLGMRSKRNIQTAVHHLRQEEVRLSTRLEAVKQEHETIERQLVRVRAGIEALGCEDDGVDEAKPVGGSRTSGARLSDQEVAALVADILQDDVPRSATALKDQVLERLRANQRSGTGLHLVLKRVLGGDAFIEGQDGFRLRQNVGNDRLDSFQS